MSKYIIDLIAIANEIKNYLLQLLMGYYWYKEPNLLVLPVRRHHSKLLTCMNLINSHNNPSRYIQIASLIYSCEKEARERLFFVESLRFSNT